MKITINPIDGVGSPVFLDSIVRTHYDWEGNAFEVNGVSINTPNGMATMTLAQWEELIKVAAVYSAPETRECGNHE